VCIAKDASGIIYQWVVPPERTFFTMAVIRLLAFRGTGGFHSPKYKSLPGLLKAGHVGIQFENDPVIYGFHPSPAAEAAAGSEDALLERLLEYEPQEGTLQDDTAIFRQAHELSHQGERTIVWVLSQQISDNDYQTIKAAATKWYTDGEMTAPYNLPKRDGSFAPNQYNCATFLKVLGVNIPTDNGKIAVYIETMKAAGATQWYPPHANL
jgi:hypothetical protein